MLSLPRQTVSPRDEYRRTEKQPRSAHYSSLFNADRGKVVAR
jgi:hypothetical protein